jgi:hypothetical protein
VDSQLTIKELPGLWTTIVGFAGSERQVAEHLIAAHRATPFALILLFAIDNQSVQAIANSLSGRVDCPVLGGTVFRLLVPFADGSQAGIHAVAFESSWVSAGVGIVENSQSPIAAGRAAVEAAAAHVGGGLSDIDEDCVLLTLFDGSSGREESFCLSTAYLQLKAKVVGGALGSPFYRTGGRIVLMLNGQELSAAGQPVAGAVVLLRSKRKIATISSVHVVETDIRTVVTSCKGKQILELDGKPAGPRCRELIMRVALDAHSLGHANASSVAVDPSAFPFGWKSKGRLYVRSVVAVTDEHLDMAGAVSHGQVLRLMRPTDIIEATRRDLALASEAVDGLQGWLAFSCLERQTESRALGLEGALLELYHEVPCVGFESLGEQSGMMLVNHTLTGLAIGAMR